MYSMSTKQSIGVNVVDLEITNEQDRSKFKEIFSLRNICRETYLS